MLTTLLRIGEWQLSNKKGEWDRFLDVPKTNSATKKGHAITNYVLALVFDLDRMDLIVNSENLIEYDDAFVPKLKALKIQGGNNKAIYATVPPSKIVQLYKTFFGKQNEHAEEGELAQAMQRDAPDHFSTTMQAVLQDMFALKEKFLEQATDVNSLDQEKELSFKAMQNKLLLNDSETIVLVYAAVKASKFGFPNVTPFSEIPEYVNFLRSKFLSCVAHGNGNLNSNGRLCYASGKTATDVEELNLSTRYSLNKMFVTETKNYASRFARDNFRINYQVSRRNQERLDLASNYLLNEGGFKVKIANIDHLIIPQFLDSDIIDLGMALQGIKRKSDLLFGLDALESTARSVMDETDSVFWINFLAFESDGNFFKTTQIIKDVPNFHFQRIMNAFTDVHWELRNASYVDWENVMAEYGKTGRLFNFNTVYGLIPIRKDKEKTNRALHLFKSVLEKRKIDKDKLFGNFCELVLCHYYTRYSSYTNISKSNKDYFRKTIRDAVFKYLAFIEVLKKLKLIDMEDETLTATELGTNKYEKAINAFFDKMKLTPAQQAMFYLGRMLNTVEYLQKQKDKKKTVIDKVNFNGMDRDDIERLRIALVEKAKQYESVPKIIFSDSQFSRLFDFNKWELNPNESVFFLLTGYSFGITSGTATEANETE